MKLKDKLDRLKPFMPSALRVRETEREPLTRERAVTSELEVAVDLSVVASEDVHAQDVARGLPSEAQADHALQQEIQQRLSTITNLRSRLDAMHQVRSTESGRRGPSYAAATKHAADTNRAPDTNRAEARGPSWRTLPGETLETPQGTLYRVVVTHDEEHRHGSAEVLLGCRASASEVALLALDPTLAEVDFSRALYLDTETTGLAGGTGTLPFLIGMAWFEGDRLVVEQLLLPRPGLEGPMLARLAERLSAASAIVSYNGKSFDWPLLRTRFILNRVAAPALPAHLDLLHCARRVYKSRLGSVRLIYLEQELMGFERIDDIPGELIPERYLAFLRGDAPGSSLKPIVDHNRSDLVALPALLGEIVRRFAWEAAPTPIDIETAHVHEPMDLAPTRPTLDGRGAYRHDLHRQDARDQLGFARVAARASAPERAIAFAHRAVEADVRGELTAMALFFVGELKLRQGDLTGAQQAFEGAASASTTGPDAARAHLALAKLHEHKTKELERALSHAAQTAAYEGDDGSARRVARLVGRLEKSERNRATPGRPGHDARTRGAL